MSKTERRENRVSDVSNLVRALNATAPGGNSRRVWDSWLNGSVFDVLSFHNAPREEALLCIAVAFVTVICPTDPARIARRENPSGFVTNAM